MADSAIPGYLVVVSCGAQKIWNRRPDAGPTQARDAYISPVFRASRRYAQHFAEKWVVLSARYGFIAPDFAIPENYNVSFYDPAAIAVDALRTQIGSMGLGAFRTVGVLGSDMYQRKVRQAFDGTSAQVRHINGNIGFPPLFMGLVRDLIANGVPFREDLPS